MKSSSCLMSVRETARSCHKIYFVCTRQTSRTTAKLCCLNWKILEQSSFVASWQRVECRAYLSRNSHSCCTSSDTIFSASFSLCYSHIRREECLWRPRRKWTVELFCCSSSSVGREQVNRKREGSLVVNCKICLMSDGGNIIHEKESIKKEIRLEINLTYHDDFKFPLFMRHIESVYGRNSGRGNQVEKCSKEKYGGVRGTPARWTTLNERMTQHTHKDYWAEVRWKDQIKYKKCILSHNYNNEPLSFCFLKWTWRCYGNQISETLTVRTHIKLVFFSEENFYFSHTINFLETSN